MRKRYWKRVRREAYYLARTQIRDHWGRAMIVIAGSLLAIVAVRFFGTDGAWKDDLISLATWLGAVGAVFGCLFYVRFRDIPPRMHAQSQSAKRAAEAEVQRLRKEIAELRAPPQHLGKLPFTDAARLAETKFGWDLSPGSFETLDFQYGLMHAGNEGLLAFAGRQFCSDVAKAHRDIRLFDDIPKQKWKELRIDIPAAFDLRSEDNFDITIFNRTLQCAEYLDPHIVDAARFEGWLRTHGPHWRGRSKISFDAREADRTSRAEAQALHSDRMPLDVLLERLMSEASYFSNIDESDRWAAIDVAIRDTLSLGGLTAYGRPEGDLIDDLVGDLSSLRKIRREKCPAFGPNTF